MCDLVDETLEGGFSDKQFGSLLVVPDLAERDCTRVIAGDSGVASSRLRARGAFPAEY